MELLIGNKNYSSWSLRPWLVFKHFSLAFTEKLLLLNGEGWKERLIEETPAGCVPVLKDGGLTIAETIAIIEYIADKYPEKSIWPDDINKRALARAASARMHSGFAQLREKAPMNLRRDFPGRLNISEVQADLDSVEKLWGECLSQWGGPFLFGEFCAADAMFAPLATRLKTYSLPMSDIVAQYVQNIHNLPAFVAWRQDALQEPWIVEQDEIDFIQANK